MSYTSGRTVKSPTTRVSTPASATRDARRLVIAHLGRTSSATINSRPDYDLTSGQSTVRTLITFPATADSTALAAAVAALPGVIKSTATAHGITVVRTA